MDGSISHGKDADCPRTAFTSVVETVEVKNFMKSQLNIKSFFSFWVIIDVFGLFLIAGKWILLEGMLDDLKF